MHTSTYSVTKLEPKLISLHEAVAAGIDKVRTPRWIMSDDYLKIDIIEQDGERMMGPWFHLYSPMNEMINGRNPVDLPAMQFDCDEQIYEPWKSKNEESNNS